MGTLRLYVIGDVGMDHDGVHGSSPCSTAVSLRILPSVRNPNPGVRAFPRVEHPSSAKCDALCATPAFLCGRRAKCVSQRTCNSAHTRSHTSATMSSILTSSRSPMAATP